MVGIIYSLNCVFLQAYCDIVFCFLTKHNVACLMKMQPLWMERTRKYYCLFHVVGIYVSDMWNQATIEKKFVKHYGGEKSIIMDDW